MISAQLLNDLRRIVGPDRVSLNRAVRETYSYDASLIVRSPDAIVFPGDTEATCAVVAALSRAGVPFVPRGFGTNLSGGSVACEGGVVVGLARLNRILSIDFAGRFAIVQAGVTNLELQNALAPRGYYYAPDPASQKVATLGGNVGENSGGPHCLKYGVTTNHVLGATVVLPDGETAAIGGAALDPPGYDLRGLVVGSEGSLGVVTEVTVRILPKPESVATLLVVYDDAESAAQSVSDIIAAGIVPATLEMMDAPIIEAVEKSVRCGYPRDAAAVLIIEADGRAAGLRTQAERIAQICRKNGCRSVREAKDSAERDRLWAGRRGAFGAVARLAPNYLVNDCTVPRSKLPEALARVAEIARRRRLPVGNVFHAGDGNLHPLLLFDSRDQDQVERVHEAGRAIMEACAALGGTISGEHGIGAEKRDAMRLIFSHDDLTFQSGLKRAFDPKNLLNPGKILPEPQEDGSPAEEGASGREDDGRGLGESAAAGGGEPPAPWTPTSPEEACELVRRARRERIALAPVGQNGGFGGCDAGRIIPISSRKLASLVEHDYVNQVAIAQSGMLLSQLQQALASHRQWLPLRPPHADRCTLGGVVATNACGPDRLRYGAPRDLLLGLSFVSAAGRVIRAGGRVVKNVAGYDVTRLLCGSAGSLGFLTELTFRTMPLPECCAAVEAEGELDECSEAAAQVLDSSLEPVFIAAESGAAGAPEGRWRFQVGYEGFLETIEDQAKRTERIFKQAGLSAPRRRDYPPAHDLFGAAFSSLYAAPYLVRSDVPLDRLPGLARRAGELPLGARLFADFGSGRLLAAASSLAEDSHRALAAWAESKGGHAILERASGAPALEPRLAARSAAERRLMRRLKQELDPCGVFAAGGPIEAPA